MRKAISITLSEANLFWLRSQAARLKKGSVSEVLDRLVGEARTGGSVVPESVRSVAGTIDLPADDPDLLRADEYVRSVLAASVARPMLVRERPPRTRRVRRG